MNELNLKGKTAVITGGAGLICSEMARSLAFQGVKSAVSHARRGDLWALSVMASFVGMSIHMWTISALAGTVTWFAYGLVAALIVLEHHFQETMQGQK